MEKLFGIVIDLFCGEFTWKRFRGLLIVLAFLLAFFLIYEWHTAAFRFDRLKKAADLLATLQQIEDKGTNDAPDLLKARKALQAETIRTIEFDPFDFAMAPPIPKTIPWRFATGTALWCVLAMLQLPPFNYNGSYKIFRGWLFLGCISGFFGIFVPTIWWPWFHLIAFPLLFIFCVLLLFFPVTFKAFVEARQTAQTNRCISNLRQLDGAIQQWAIENKKTAKDIPQWSEIQPYLKESPICPNGGKYTISRVDACPTCSLSELGHTLA